MTEPRSVKKVPGMGGKVFDYRGTGLCPPNGGRIRPLAFVHHIPVIPNAVGLADFERLGRDLRAQGLAIQAATDAEGNVALFTRLDELCFGHKGANHLACGAEHMHLSLNEDWTEAQMRAAAWLSNRVLDSFGIPLRRANLLPGDGFFKTKTEYVVTKPIGIKRRGHTTHKAVSDGIGSHQRSDPGSKFDFKHLFELTRFFREHQRF